MPVSFSHIPAGWRQPLYWVEVDSSKAGLPVFHMPALLVGIKLAAGTATVNMPVPVSGPEQANGLFGRGSELALMAASFFANNASQEVWALPVAEPTGVKAAGAIVVTGVPTAAGTFHLYVAGVHVPVAVTANETVANVALGIQAAINANLDLPVTSAAPTAGSCPVTCRWQGTTGNDILMSDNYYGVVGSEQMPTGLTVTYTAVGTGTPGTGVPAFTTAIANLGEHEAEFVCLPYTDSASLLAWETEFGFGDTGRWGWMRQHFGHIFTAKRAIYADQLSFTAAGARNSAQLSSLAVELLAPSPVWAWAAAYCAKAARGLSNDPARPLQTLHLEGILPATGPNRYLISDLNSMATHGIATQRTESDNVPMIARDTTTYQLNLYAQTDDAYTDVTTLATLAKVLRNQRQAITSKFPRHKLADDGTRFGPGQAIVTPKTVKAELVAQYRMDEFNGLVENAKAFKDNLIVERDPNDPNRLNVAYPPDLVNQLRIFAVLTQFRLQYDRGIDVAIL